jgi:hypothetical protein
MELPARSSKTLYKAPTPSSNPEPIKHAISQQGVLQNLSNIHVGMHYLCSTNSTTLPCSSQTLILEPLKMLISRLAITKHPCISRKTRANEHLSSIRIPIAARYTSLRPTPFFTGASEVALRLKTRACSRKTIRYPLTRSCMQI